ncbi:MAG: EAL domain-containing protein [Ferrimicrobium sp.]
MEQLTFASQDIVNLAHYRVENIELLVRYAHDPSGNACRIVAELTTSESYALLMAGVRHAKRLLQSGESEIRPHVNLSVGDMAQFLREWTEDLAGITVEVCEGTVTQQQLREVINRVHELHGLVALDDLLSGDWHSPNLLDHPWDVIKIDRCLWQRTEVERAAIVRSLDGWILCVEGIESRRQVEESLGLGVRWGQGYWFDTPRVGRIAPIFDVSDNALVRQVRRV